LGHPAYGPAARHWHDCVVGAPDASVMSHLVGLDCILA
jgi:hypothetical protein